MRRQVWIIMCMLLLSAMPAAVGAAPVQGGNATPGGDPGNITGNVTVVDVIAGNENLTMFAETVEAANLTDVLRTGGPYTVFAPNNEAFGALGNETIKAFLNDTETLERVLRYHVVEGNFPAEGLLAMAEAGNETTLLTLGGETLTITRTDDGLLMVDNATVIVPDINAGNGIIHIVDAVLLPENVTVNESGEDAEQEDGVPAIPLATYDTIPPYTAPVDTVPALTYAVPTYSEPIETVPVQTYAVPTYSAPVDIVSPPIDTGPFFTMAQTPVPVSPLTVGTVSYPRPATGTNVSGEEPDEGYGELEVDNSEGWNDAVAVLTPYGSNETIVGVYIRENDTYTVGGIGDGIYDLYFTAGDNWNQNATEFTKNATYMVFDEPLEFETEWTAEGYYYTIWEVTLYAIEGGNVTPVPVNETDFPGL